MSNKTNLKPVAALVGVALAGSLSAMNLSAGENPFGVSQLEGGYMQLASSHEGEGKCGGDKGDKEGKCGDDKGDKEGKCGGDKGDKEGKCGGDKEDKD